MQPLWAQRARDAGNLLAQAGWGDLVESMRGAIENRSHAVYFGYALAAVLFVWINWRLARWAMGRGGDGPAGGHTKDHSGA